MKLAIRTATLAVLCAATGAIADVVYSDTEFVPSNWGFETAIIGSGGSSGAAQVATGNPGNARELTNSVNAGGTIWGFSRYGTTTATRYDPSVQGAIASIDFSIDFRFVSGAGGQGQALMLGAKQGTLVYAAAYTVTGSSDAWTSYNATALTAADFSLLTGSGPAIDLSASGAPLRFGFIVGNSATGSSYSETVDYDNFRVSLHNVPTPAPLGAILLAAPLFPRRRRSR